MRQATYDYSDETVVITGGSSGIGREIALRFADAGATVLNADVEESPKDEDADRPSPLSSPSRSLSDSGGRSTWARG